MACKRRTRIVVTCVAVFLALVALRVWAHFNLNEALVGKEGSLAYRLKVKSEIVREFPVIKPVAEPDYGYTMGDGGGPRNRVSYTSSENLKVLEDTLKDHLLSLGFSIDTIDKDIYLRGERQIWLRIWPESDGTVFVNVEDYL